MQRSKSILISGIFTYGILFILALWFYKERTIFLDIAFHLFYIIKDDFFAIQNNRFGAILTQMFPLMGSKVGLPLNSLLVIYSLAFIILYSSVFLLCIKMKKPLYALLMLGFSLLITTDTFYWVQSEFPQGIAFTILFFAFIASRKGIAEFSTFDIVAFSIMLLTIAFFHPLLVFVFTFIILFRLLGEHTSEERKILFSSLAILFIIFAIKSYLFKTEYDSEAMSKTDNFFTLFPDYFRIQANYDFLILLVTKYYLLLIGLVTATIFYLKERNLRKLFLLFAFFGGYTGLINITYYQGGESFYMENLYQPLSIFVLVPLIFDVLPKWEGRYTFALIGFCMVFRLGHIYMNGQSYTERLQWHRDYLSKTEQFENKKLIVSQNNEDVAKDKLIMTWATCYEFWLLSTVEGGKSRSVVIDENPEALQWALPSKHGFVTKWGVFPYSELPSKYFILRDTSSYQVIQ